MKMLNDNVLLLVIASVSVCQCRQEVRAKNNLRHQCLKRESGLRLKVSYGSCESSKPDSHDTIAFSNLLALRFQFGSEKRGNMVDKSVHAI